MQLLLFERDPERARAALAAGVDRLVLDGESRGKEERQAGEDLELNRDTPDDVREVARATGTAPVFRVNPRWEGTPREVEAAIGAGAGLVLLPMVREAGDVEVLLRAVDGRARCGILVETPEAVERARDLARFPLDLVYVGLNDLRLLRGTAVFAALVDGTVERVREAFSAHAFGFAGLTVLDGGAPVPCRLLLAEMVRLQCAFAFLRRSWKRDAAGRDWSAEVRTLRAGAAELRVRDAAAIDADRAALVRAVSGIAP